MAVAPERSRPGRGSTDQIGAGMATTYALPAIADQVAARAPPGPLVLRSLAIAGLLTAIGSLALALTNDGVSGIQVALLEWISIPYIAAGLVAWWRRPDSRLGVLMIVGGAQGRAGAARFHHRAVAGWHRRSCGATTPDRAATPPTGGAVDRFVRARARDDRRPVCVRCLQRPCVPDDPASDSDRDRNLADRVSGRASRCAPRTSGCRKFVRRNPCRSIPGGAS